MNWIKIMKWITLLGLSCSNALWKQEFYCILIRMGELFLTKMRSETATRIEWASHVFKLHFFLYWTSNHRTDVMFVAIFYAHTHFTPAAISSRIFYF